MCQDAPCATQQTTISPDWHWARNLQPLLSTVPKLLAYLCEPFTRPSQENTHRGKDIWVWIISSTMIQIKYIYLH